MTEFNPGGAADLNQAVKLRYEANADTNAFTDAEKAKLAGIEAGATANAADATLRDRGTHTGEQPISTVTGLQAALDGKAAAAHTHPATEISDATAAGRAMLTAADAAAQTALLGTFTSGAKGLAPASGGGTTNFLRADGTWAAPPGGGGSGDVTGPASSADNAIARFDGTTGRLIQDSGVTVTDLGALRLPAADPAAPPADVVALFGARFANRMLPGFMGPSGLDSALQPLLAHNKIAYFSPAGNATTVTSIGMANLSAIGRATTRNVATTNLFTRTRRLGYVSAATAGSVAGFRSIVVQISTGDGSGLGGFFWCCRFGVAAHTPDAHCFVGLRGTSTAATGTTALPALTNAIGMGFDDTMSNMHIVYAGSAFQTPIDLGANFPARTASVDLYELSLFAPPNAAGTVNYHVRRLNTGDSATGTLTGDATVLPQSGALLTLSNSFINNQATAASVALDLVSLYVETDY